MDSIQIIGFRSNVPWHTVSRDKAIDYARWLAEHITARGNKVEKVQKHIKGLKITQEMLDSEEVD